MVTSSLQAERRALENILANSNEHLLALPFGEPFYTSESIEFGFSLKIMVFFS